MDLSLNDEEIEDRFLLRGRMEILSCLNDLIRSHEGVTVYFNQGRDFVLTSLLEAGVDRLLFDLGGDDRANQRLEKSQGCVFVAVLDGIRIQFKTGAPARFSWGGADAFRVPLPGRVLRLQRRESYRVMLPVSKAPKAALTDDEGTLLAELPIHDLSVGGAGLTATKGTQLAEGQELTIAFPLGDKQRVRCRAQVRHVTPLGQGAQSANWRVGVCFTDLPASMGANVQRYILKVEHQRAALARKD